MKTTVNGKEQTIKSLVDAAHANNFPDLLLIAGGKVTNAGAKAKFRIKVVLRNGNDSSTIKTWNETVEFTPPGFGNLFDGKRLERDLIDGDQLEFKFEVDLGHGAGFEAWDPVNTQIIEGPPNTPAFSAIAFLFDNGHGVSGLVGMLWMNV